MYAGQAQKPFYLHEYSTLQRYMTKEMVRYDACHLLVRKSRYEGSVRSLLAGLVRDKLQIIT